MTPFKTTHAPAVINGVSVSLRVQIYCEQSELCLEDVIGDAEDKELLERKINRGDLMIADICVKVCVAGVEGFDSLGGCYISKPDDVTQYLEDHAMIEQAIDNLKTEMQRVFNDLKPYFQTPA